MTPVDELRGTLSDKQWRAIQSEARRFIRANDGDSYLALLFVLGCRKQEQMADMSAEISPYERLMNV